MFHSNQAQKAVLDEIISVLISKQLITELMKPQATYSHESVRDIIEDVTQSSMMRLDAVSMNKLWDLITMVFKWQVTVSEEVIDITLRHLYEVENYLTNPDTQIQLHKVQNLVDNFNKILSKKEKKELRDDILYWLKDANVRVSLLLRMGLQNMEGIFITDNLDPTAEKMLKNLGENIYSVTQNGRILEKNRNKPEPEVNELQLFVDQILGDRRGSCNDNRKHLRLDIDDQNGNNNEKTKSKIVFDNIDVNTEDQQMQKMMNEMEVSGKEDGCLKDDLLAMIGGEDLNKD
ncbi:Oscp1 domain containing protein [Asbolus verrucosus]|uniref:Oscp1 domain containing protein n=1 Tax=Asbolus verrucosus TaxID=1661398 RepID=A0A482WDE8_ASBVE|nr:Oscp1 domain containing protein [Asbolus verrucosus]